MTANTTLKTASAVLDTPAELATVLGHRQAQAVVVETSKPAAAEALGITLHRFNKWAAWEPQTHAVAGDLPGTVHWRSATADEQDDSFSWWYINDEGYPVEVPWGEHAEDEDEPADEEEGYEVLVGLDAPEGPQVIMASRHVILTGEPEPEVTPEGQALADELEAELGDTVARLGLALENGDDLDLVRSKAPLVQYTDDGSRDFEEELTEAEVQDDRDTLADIDREAGMEPVPATAPEPVIVLTPKQSQAIRERDAAAAELEGMDDRALAVKLAMRLNRWDRDEAEKIIGMGGVQCEMWTTAAAIAREHFNA